MAKFQVRMILVSAALLLTAVAAGHAQGQEAAPEFKIAPMGNWLEYSEVKYSTTPVLLHLRTGYERAVVMPEPVELPENQPLLTGCMVEIEDNVIGFYPSSVFTRTAVTFLGVETGNEYILLVRSSPNGKRQPLRISL